MKNPTRKQTQDITRYATEEDIWMANKHIASHQGNAN